MKPQIAITTCVLLIFAGLAVSGCLYPEEPLPAAITSVEVTIETSAGFTGSGIGTTRLTKDGRLVVTKPGPSGKTCTITLSKSDHNALLAFAALVDWNGLKKQYINPDNPYGCCDQVGYHFSAKLGLADSSTPTFASFWYDEAMYDSVFGLPSAFRLFIQKFWDLKYGYEQKGLCISGVSLGLDKTTYTAGDKLQPSWSNGTSEAIFLPGCTTYSLEKFDAAKKTWYELGPGAVCAWEGYAVVVAAGESWQAMTLQAPQFTTPPDVDGVGTYRLVGQYWTGCQSDPPAPISTAGCTGGPFQVISSTFTVSK